MSNDEPRLYSVLVEDGNDFLGIVAYSVYKRQKMERIVAFQAANEGRFPENSDLSEFYQLCRSNTQISHFENEALRLVNEFCDNVLEEERRKLQTDNDRQFKGYCLNLRPNFWYGVAQGVVASLGFVLLTGVTIFLLWSLKQGAKVPLEKIFNIKIIPNEESDLPPANSRPSPR